MLILMLMLQDFLVAGMFDGFIVVAWARPAAACEDKVLYFRDVVTRSLAGISKKTEVLNGED